MTNTVIEALTYYRSSAAEKQMRVRTEVREIAVRITPPDANHLSRLARDAARAEVAVRLSHAAWPVTEAAPPRLRAALSHAVSIIGSNGPECELASRQSEARRFIMLFAPHAFPRDNNDQFDTTQIETALDLALELLS